VDPVFPAWHPSRSLPWPVPLQRGTFRRAVVLLPALTVCNRTDSGSVEYIYRSDGIGALGRQAVQETSAATKSALQQLYLHYRERVEANLPLCHPRAAGLRIFSQFDEDGISLLLLGAVGVGTYRFVDIGDGATGSNTANLALNLGFDGAMFDGNLQRVRYGRRFDGRHPDSRCLPPRFEKLLVSPPTSTTLSAAPGSRGRSTCCRSL
jgi:hypothetical protein